MSDKPDDLGPLPTSFPLNVAVSWLRAESRRLRAQVYLHPLQAEDDQGRHLAWLMVPAKTQTEAAHTGCRRYMDNADGLTRFRGREQVMARIDLLPRTEAEAQAMEMGELVSLFARKDWLLDKEKGLAPWEGIEETLKLAEQEMRRRTAHIQGPPFWEEAPAPIVEAPAAPSAPEPVTFQERSWFPVALGPEQDNPYVRGYAQRVPSGWVVVDASSQRDAQSRASEWLPELRAAMVTPTLAPKWLILPLVPERVIDLTGPELEAALAAIAGDHETAITPERYSPLTDVLSFERARRNPLKPLRGWVMMRNIATAVSGYAMELGPPLPSPDGRSWRFVPAETVADAQQLWDDMSTQARREAAILDPRDYALLPNSQSAVGAMTPTEQDALLANAESLRRHGFGHLRVIELVREAHDSLTPARAQPLVEPLDTPWLPVIRAETEDAQSREPRKAVRGYAARVADKSEPRRWRFLVANSADGAMRQWEALDALNRNGCTITAPARFLVLPVNEETAGTLTLADLEAVASMRVADLHAAGFGGFTTSRGYAGINACQVAARELESRRFPHNKAQLPLPIPTTPPVTQVDRWCRVEDQTHTDIPRYLQKLASGDWAMAYGESQQLAQEDYQKGKREVRNSLAYEFLPRSDTEARSLTREELLAVVWAASDLANAAQASLIARSELRRRKELEAESHRLRQAREEALLCSPGLMDWPAGAKPEDQPDLTTTLRQGAKAPDSSAYPTVMSRETICAEEDARILGALLAQPAPEERPQATAERGVKWDGNKARWSLFPWDALSATLAVLESGARKYRENNWLKVPEARTRYFDAAMRHLIAWREGERFDHEWGYPHLAHACCCILFLLAMELRGMFDPPTAPTPAETPTKEPV